MAALGAALACGSNTLDGSDPVTCPSQEQAATTKCAEQSLDPETDPESPDFGRIPCRVFAAGTPDSGFCSCDREGYRPLGSIDTKTARDRLHEIGICNDACCDGICFCELLQLSGDALARCQAGVVDDALDYAGFCYVEPDLGVGDPITVEDCKPSERRLLRFTPDYANYYATILCVKSP